MFRPRAPFATWVSQAAAGTTLPVQPTEEELAALQKVRVGLKKTKTQTLKPGG